MNGRMRNVRKRSLGHLDTRTIQILLQTHIELSQPTVLQIGHTLLLILDISPGAKLVWRHIAVGPVGALTWSAGIGVGACRDERTEAALEGTQHKLRKEKANGRVGERNEGKEGRERRGEKRGQQTVSKGGCRGLCG